MNALQELRLHAEALAFAVDQDPNFFAAIVQYVKRLKEITAFPTAELSRQEFGIIADKLSAFWYEYRSTDDWAGPNQTDNTKGTVHDIVRLAQKLLSLGDEDYLKLIPKPSKHASSPEGQAVFIGHGGSRLWARVQVFLQQELHLEVVTYESQSRVGESIVPILEDILSKASFAVLVLTAEDETAEGSRRARQNVVHEAGLFQGRLGFRKAVLLVQEGLEEFTNVAGLQNIRFSGENVEQAFYELQRVLKRENMV